MVRFERMPPTPGLLRCLVRPAARGCCLPGAPFFLAFLDNLFSLLCPFYPSGVRMPVFFSFIERFAFLPEQSDECGGEFDFPEL